MPDIKIEKLKRRDKKEARELVADVLEEVFGSRPKNTENMFNKKYYEIFYVAKIKNKVVGTIALKKKSKTSGRLKRMYVDKNYRKIGVGKKLFERILDYCKKKGIKSLTLTTYPEMEQAQKFYKKQGFRPIRQLKDRRIKFSLKLEK